ncbi:unnamed protein product, partial [Closterium sp. NIES-54]
SNTAGAGGAGAADGTGTTPRREFSTRSRSRPRRRSLTERREPETRASTPVRARHVARPRPPGVPGTHGMALRPSSIPQRLVLPEPPASSLPHVPDPESDLAHAASPTAVAGLAHKGYNPIRDRFFQGTPHSATRLVALPCPACRIALLAVASPCPVSRVALLAVASPCCPHAALLPTRRPALPALSRPAARTALLPATLLLPALLRAALLPARRPAGSRTAACTALLVTPCCAPPCWPAPCYPQSPTTHCPAARTTLLLPPLLCAVLLDGTLLPACHPASSHTPHHPAHVALLLPTLPCPGCAPHLPSRAPPLLALPTSLVLARRPACVLPCWSRAALLCPPWLLSEYSNSIMRAWLNHDAAARLDVRNHLPLAERAHFGQHKPAKALYDAVVARYSSPATAALSRLILPYLFPELSAFATVKDLITLYFIVTRLLDSLRAVRDHFLALDPTNLTIDLLEKHLLAVETSPVAVGAARGTPRTPFFEGCSPSPLAPSYASTAAVDILGAEDVEAASALSGKNRSSKGKGGKSGGGGSEGGGGGGSGGGGGGGGSGSGGSGGGSGGFGGGGGGSGGGGGGGGGGSGSGGGGNGGGRGGVVQRGGSGGDQRNLQQRQSETPAPQQLRECFAQCGASGGNVRCPYVIRTGDHAGQTCGKLHTQHRCFSLLDDAWRTEFGDEAEHPRWSELFRSGVDIFCLDYDAILAAMYALFFSAEGDCYLFVPPDTGIDAAALGASESALPGTAPAEAVHTFTLYSGASRCFFRVITTLMPLPAPVPVRQADPSGGSVLARSSTVLPCPSVPSSSLSGLHLPSFFTNLVSTAALQDAMVSTTTPAGQRVSICMYTRTGCHLTTFTRRPGLILYILTTKSPQVATSSQVSALGPVAAPCSYRLLSHQTLLWHHRLGHPSLPRLHGMHSRLLVSGLPRVAKRHIGLVMEVARTYMIHAAAPHFLWPFAGPAQSGVSQVDPLLVVVPVEVAAASGASRGGASGGATSGGIVSGGVEHARAEPGGVEPGGAESEGAESGDAEPGGAELGGTEPEGAELGSTESESAESGDVEPRGTASAGGPAGASPRLSPRREPLSLQQLREWFAQCTRLRSGAAGARGSAAGGTGAGGIGATSLGCAGVTAGAGGTGGAGAAGPGGAHTRGTRAAGASSVGGAGAGDPGAGDPCTSTGGGGARGAGAGVSGAGGAGAEGAGGTRAGGAGAGGDGAGGAGAGDPGAGGTGAGGTVAGDPRAGSAGAGGAGASGPGAVVTMQRRPFFFPSPSSSLPPPVSDLRQPDSPLPDPSPYAEQTDSLIELRDPESHPASPICPLPTGRRVPRPRPPHVPGTHVLAFCPSSVPLRVPLPSPPVSSLPESPDPESDLARAAKPTIPRFLATVATDSSFESAAVSALVAELVDFAATSHLD